MSVVINKNLNNSYTLNIDKIIKITPSLWKKLLQCYFTKIPIVYINVTSVLFIKNYEIVTIYNSKLIYLSLMLTKFPFNY